MHIIVPDFRAARVLVVGDLMLDRYWHGDTGRISPEAPVPVVRVGQSEDRAGGAANVALNAAALGLAPTLLALTGKDEAAEILCDQLTARGVCCEFLDVPGFPTITKLRVMSRRQQLIRLDFERGFPHSALPALLERFREMLKDVDVVVLSDYAKGTLGDAAGLVRAAKEVDCIVVVDPKGGNFERYRGADFLTPNRAEFEGVVGHCENDAALVARARNLIIELDLKGLLITRGEVGMTLVQGSGEPLHLPAHAREVYDVTGAGDTVIAVLSSALAAGADLPMATALANVAAGLVVAKMGTATVSIAEIRRALHGAQAMDHGLVTEEQLRYLLEEARAHGERVVMTNGCFDLLHTGHVAYLQQARTLGDRLVVAVNDDASVSRLKGEMRPVTPLDQRMAVLAGLAAVDWVVPFSEDTPERLVCAVQPDVLVKGGDYSPSQIAGSDYVREFGGDVVVLDLVDGISTSGIMERIRQR